MKNFLKCAALVVFAASIFAGCSRTASRSQETAQSVNSAPPKNDAPANAPQSADKSNKFPPLPVVVAQADIKQLDGTSIKLGDKKGKVMLLNMWATWCGPCRGEMPTFIELQDKYRDKNFEIIGLDVDDESADEITSFKNELKLNYTLAWSDETVQKELVNISKFTGIPQSFLIDRDGNLRGVFVGGGKKVLSQLVESVDQAVNE